MIGTVLSHISDELNTYVCRKQGLSPDVSKVALSSIIGLDGGLAVKGDNLVLLTMIDLRQDPAAPTWQKVPQRDLAGNTWSVKAEAFNVNLYLLFSTYFPDDLKNGLDHLSYVIQFFMSRSTMDRHNSPGLPRQVNKLSFEMETQDFQQKGYMWGLLGGKYLPSVLYKMRMLTFLDSEPEEFRPPITEVDTNLQ